MDTWISLLRAVNVSGQNRVRMADLKALYEQLGFAAVRTYIQSGNVVFDSPAANPFDLEGQIEAALAAQLDCRAAVLMRSAADLSRILALDPFGARGDPDPAHRHVVFCRDWIDPAALAQLAVPAGESAEYSVVGREIFLYLPEGAGRTKLSNAFFEQKLNMLSTARNWNTVQALLDLAGLPPP